MGLDQYLYKKTYGTFKNEDSFIELKNCQENIKIRIGDIESVEMKVLYWRKNYAINDYFMNKVRDEGEDNCRYYYIKNSYLEELRDILMKIVNEQDKKASLQIAKKHLPTEDLEEYFGDYLADFKRTLEQLTKIINSPDFNSLRCDFYYYIWY